MNGTDRGRCGGQIPATTATGYGGIEIVPGGRRRFARELLPLYRGAAARVRRQPLTDRSTDRLDKVSPERGVPFPSLPPSQLNSYVLMLGGVREGPGGGEGGILPPLFPSHYVERGGIKITEQMFDLLGFIQELAEDIIDNCCTARAAMETEKERGLEDDRQRS